MRRLCSFHLILLVLLHLWAFSKQQSEASRYLHFWNHPALPGLGLPGMPMEELLFASGSDLYWAGVYEHQAQQGSHHHTRCETSPLSA